MFLLHCLAIVVVAYACGALVADVTMVSRTERALPSAARALFGILLVTTFFAGAWQFLSIGQSWILGIALLAMHAAGQGPREVYGRIRSGLVAHARHLAAVLAASIVFFLPLLAANEYGPFTEGGGDVTIYSDASKFLVEQGMTSFGQPSPDLRNIVPNLEVLKEVRTPDRTRFAPTRELLYSRFRDRVNPPAAELGAVRLVAAFFFSSIFYAPYAQFQPFSGELNYPAYYGMQAFFYATMLLCVWHFFRRFGRFAAWLGLGMAAASHSLVAVHYNAYSMQAISLAICAAMLLAATRVPLVSAAGWRVYGAGTLIVWLCYTHYMSILGPLLFIAALASLPGLRDAMPSAEARAPRPALRPLRWISAGAFAVLAALLFVGGSGKAIEFISGLLQNFVGDAKSEYLGDRIPVQSWKYLWFVFGLVSQQHLQPFARETIPVLASAMAGSLAGLGSLVLGLAVLARWLRRAPADAAIRPVLAAALYLILLATVAVQMYLANSSLYTQAKGAQNVLVLLYAAMTLPLALSWTDARFRRSLLRPALAVALCGFIATLLVPRVAYLERIAHGEDRAAIMERSYFDAARRIRAADANAFVLFEPRRSADLYLGIQPFTGLRMVPTRHLVLDKLIFSGLTIHKGRVGIAELVSDADVPHLWTLWHEKNGEWQAMPLTQVKAPRLIAFADDYELGFGPRPRGALPAETATFSYVRNGDVMVYTPGARALSVELRMEPRDAKDRERMLRRLRAEGPIDIDGPVVVVHRDIAAGPPRLARIAGFDGEYWASVRVDGAELK